MMDQTEPRQSRDQRWIGIVIGAVVVITLVGMAAWILAPRAIDAPGPGGPGLSISLVAPVEPVSVEGEVLEVGPLSDGFDRTALERQPETVQADYMPPDAYAGEDWGPVELMPLPRPVIRQTTSSGGSTITSTDPLADGSRLFGFDRRPTEPALVPSEDRATAETPSSPAKDSETFFE